MTIHDFARESGVSLRTLRYYVEQGLLLPPRAGAYLDFDDRCRADLLLIHRLKDCAFTMREIGQWLDIMRDASCGAAERRQRQHTFLRRKNDEVAQSLGHVRVDLEKLDSKILSLGREISRTNTGCSLSLFPLLCCPHCNLPLQYQNVRISNQAVIQGEGQCACGYTLTLEDGIVIVPASHSDAASRITVTDHNRETYNSMCPTEISIFHKNFNWVLQQLKKLPLAGKVVFENCVDVVSFLSTGIALLDGRARYILADSDYHVILDIKNRIEALNLDLQVLYLVCPTLEYPLQKQSVDVLIDFYSTEIFQRFNIPSLANVMRPFLRANAHLVGVYTHVAKGHGTLRNNRAQYPNSFSGRYQLEAFQASLAESGIVLLEADITDTYDSSNSIPAFQSGDWLGDYAFFGQLAQPQKHQGKL